jgi:hypothetical protein
VIFLAAPAAQLAFENAGGGEGGDAHAVAHEQDHVPGGPVLRYKLFGAPEESLSGRIPVLDTLGTLHYRGSAGSGKCGDGEHAAHREGLEGP